MVPGQIEQVNKYKETSHGARINRTGKKVQNSTSQLQDREIYKVCLLIRYTG